MLGMGLKPSTVARYTKLPLANHYSILVDVEKELDFMDFERLNNLNNLIALVYGNLTGRSQ